MTHSVSGYRPAPAETRSTPSHRWRSRDLAFFGAAFILLVAAAAILQAVAQIFIGEATGGVLFLLALTALVEGGLVFATLVLVRNIYGLSYREEMRISRDYRISNRTLVVLGMGLALSVILVSALVAELLPNLLPAQETPLEQLLATTESVLLFAVFGVALAPALEEIMFRGFLFRVLEDVVGVPVAVWTTAVIFAVFHSPQLWPNWPAIGVILGVGYVLSKLRERTHSVIPGFIVHTVYNALLFLLFAFGTFVKV
jgi:hypothetical protein